VADTPGFVYAANRMISPGRFEPTFLHFDSIESTNLEAMRQAKAGGPEGLCVVAREQTRGRGRLDRSWESPKDAGLYLSIVLRPQMAIEQWPLITLMTALAVSDALIHAFGLRSDIKWPNDICVNERKLGGILAETIETDRGPALIVGIGINLKKATFPGELAQRAISVESATGTVPNGELLLEKLIGAIVERYDLLSSRDGREHTIREWCASSSYAFDRRVRVSGINDTFEGLTRGLESDGALRVETQDGKVRTVRAGDVTALRAG
jgi:BirA family biotin operon repressor/biotin-[acetyl-CoA-carboxylase] ligase